MILIPQNNNINMKNIKLLLILAAVALQPIVINAQQRHFDFTHKTGKSKVYYKITDKQLLTAEVTYKNSELGSYKGNVEIADSVKFRGKTYVVTSIGDSAFFGCEELDTVTLSSTIKSIGRNAFSLTNVRNIKFNEQLEEITAEAFANCNLISEFTVTNSIKKIGDFAFENCGLRKLIINCKEISSPRAFNNISTLNEITIGENVQTLSYEIFSGCDNIRTINYNATSFIGFSPIESLPSLTKINIGSNVVSLPENFIRNCVNVTEVVLPENLNAISSMAFANTSVREITIKDKINEMGIAVFKDCSKLEFVSLPNNLAVIPDLTFESCEKLYEVAIPDNLTEIDTGAFINCKSLPAFVFPKSVEIIGKNAFDGCLSLKQYIVESKNPPVLENSLYMSSNAFVDIDCSAILSYKNAPFWDSLTYNCDMDNVTVQSTMEREIFDKTRNKSFTERIINTGDLSYVITNERNKYVSLIASAISYRDDITRTIDIPARISDGENIYTVTGIESIGVCQSVFIPASIKTIDTMVFSGIDLENIEVDKDNPYFASLDGVLYSKNMKTLVAYPPKKAANDNNQDPIVLPDEVEVIRYGAFAASKFPELIIGKNVKSIGTNQDILAFQISKDNPYFIGIDRFVTTKDSSRIITAPKQTTHALETFTIPNCIKRIDNNVFKYWQFDTLIMQSTVPPEIFEQSFDLTKNFICIVPKGSMNAYTKNPYFKQMNLQEEKPTKTTKKKTTKNKK